MDEHMAAAFVEQWVAAWNDHDLEALLAFFSEEVIFTSPMAVQLLEGSHGVVRGKEALRHYWSEGLRRLPELRFEVLGYYLGINTLVVHYRNERGGRVCEVLLFAGSLVREGHGAYFAGPE